MSLVVTGVQLSYSRTVDRALIHRRNLTEVFLTDARRTGAEGFVAAALLPLVHPHYTSHTGPAGRAADPMLLLECCRQAETYAAHAFFDVAMGASFVLRNWSINVRPDALGTDALGTDAIRTDPSGPTELCMTAATRNPRVIRGRIQGLDYEFDLWVSGARIGGVRMAVGYVAQEAYAGMRARRRGCPPPSSDRLPPVVAGQPVEPALVGRVNATDTLLLDVAAGPDAVTATLRIPVENVSLLDHAQDHVPGMVLVEAARQIAALATKRWGGAAPDSTTMIAMESSFAAYTELDEPTTITATPAGATGTVEIAFHQGGEVTSRVRVAMEVIVR